MAEIARFYRQRRKKINYFAGGGVGLLCNESNAAFAVFATAPIVPGKPLAADITSDAVRNAFFPFSFNAFQEELRTSKYFLMVSSISSIFAGISLLLSATMERMSVRNFATCVMDTCC